MALVPDTARGWVAWLSPGLMILFGVVLFFIPAPPTTMIGVGLILAGAVLWLIDFFGGERREQRRDEPERPPRGGAEIE